MARVRVSILQHIVPLACHRVLVIDPGRRQLKLLLAESRLGRFRIVHRQAVAVPEEGALDPEEMRQHMALLVPELGAHQTAIVLPQHKAITQTIDVPHNHVQAPREYLVAEARKLSGLPEEELAVAFTRLQPWATLSHPHVLSFCKRKELDLLIDQFAPEKSEEADENDQLIEITTTAQGLIAASKMLSPPPLNAVLVDLGAQETTAVILMAGQGVFATSFEGGSDNFTRALLEAGCTTAEEAESVQRSTDFFQGPNTVQALASTVTKWHAELSRCISEWTDDNPGLKITPGDLPVYLAGGGAAQKGLVDYLNKLGPMRFQCWPNPPHAGPMDSFWVACGVARVALGKEPGSLSFLPDDFQQRRAKRTFWEAVQAAVFMLLVTAAALLAFGTWHNSKLLKLKRELIAQTTSALESARAVGELMQQVDAKYAALRPIIVRRGQTITTLRTWSAVNQVRTNNDYWMVLFADSLSYLEGTTAPQSSTNQPAPGLAQLHLNPGRRTEFVTEVCIPQQGEPARRILSQFVLSLKGLGVFERVDELPTERKREIVDPRVIISNQVYGVSMEMALPSPLGGGDSELRRNSSLGALRRSPASVSTNNQPDTPPPTATSTNR